jgi:hypothetical protein
MSSKDKKSGKGNTPNGELDFIKHGKNPGGEPQRARRQREIYLPGYLTIHHFFPNLCRFFQFARSAAC